MLSRTRGVETMQRRQAHGACRPRRHGYGQDRGEDPVVPKISQAAEAEHLRDDFVKLWLSTHRPTPVRQTARSSQELTISDHDAGTAAVRVAFPDVGDQGINSVYVRCTVVETRPGTISFILSSVPHSAKLDNLDAAVDRDHDNVAVR